MDQYAADIIQKIQSLKPMLAAKDVIRIRLFGSTVTGNAREDSDVDLLLDFKSTPSLFDLSEIQVTLEEKLERPVDIVMADGIFKEFKNRILNEAIDV